MMDWVVARLRASGVHDRAVLRFAIGIAVVCGLVLVAGEVLRVSDLVTPPGRTGKSLYVAPAGSSTNDGSRRRPLDLATVLGAESPAKPGDTIWLLGGSYRGTYVSKVAGTAAAPIVIRRMPGTRVTLDGASAPEQTTLLVEGPHVWFWGFEVTNSDPHRMQYRAGNPTMRGTAIDVRGPGARVINAVVHDAANGIGVWSSAESAEINGCLVYFNGIEGTERGHGHGIYVQNTGPVKRITDNVLFEGFGAGIHAYTENGNLDNLQLEGNVSFNNGALSAASHGTQFNILLGGLRPAWNPVLRDNIAYVASETGSNTELGYRAGCHEAVVEGNYFVGGDPLNVTNCENVEMRDNTLYGHISPSVADAYPDNQFLRTRPTANEVFVRPNRYERGRAHIIVFNWERLQSVDVSAAGAYLRDGDRYEIRDAQNFYGRPLVTGTYWRFQRITIGMSNLMSASPVGDVPMQPIHSAPTFGVFIMLRRDS
jgi:hypothetical protein